MKKTRVTIDAKFPQMKPAHLAFVSQTGEGSNFDRAVRNGIQNVFADKRFKGKNKKTLSPFTVTISLIEENE